MGKERSKQSILEELHEIHFGLHCESIDEVPTLKTVLFKRNCFESDSKPVVCSEIEPMYISHAFEKFCHLFKVEHKRIPT